MFQVVFRELECQPCRKKKPAPNQQLGHLPKRAMLDCGRTKLENEIQTCGCATKKTDRKEYKADKREFGENKNTERGPSGQVKKSHGPKPYFTQCWGSAR